MGINKTEQTMKTPNQYLLELLIRYKLHNPTESKPSVKIKNHEILKQ